MIKKLNQIKSVIKQNLEQNERLRDSDNRLICTIWYKELGKEAVENMSAMDLLNKIASGLLSSSESIRRCRQKTQEQYPELRGKSYKIRKTKANEVTKQIHSV